jgi:hypothetical protein
MTTTTSASDASTIPEIAVPAWAWVIVALSAMAIYLVTLENGALLGDAAANLHELFHDGRHLAAVPCH